MLRKSMNMILNAFESQSTLEIRCVIGRFFIYP